MPKEKFETSNIHAGNKYRRTYKIFIKGPGETLPSPNWVPISNNNLQGKCEFNYRRKMNLKKLLAKKCNEQKVQIHLYTCIPEH